MVYNDPKDPRNSTRMLRRLWECTVFKGDPDATKPKTKKETVIAWNEVDAIRKFGGSRLAKQPENIGWVTWPREQEDYVYFIQNPTEGPDEKKKVRPSVGGVDDEENRDF